MENNKNYYKTIINEIRSEGLYKSERTLTTPQGVEIKTKEGARVLNFCANNYLGLANHPNLINAAKSALDDHGLGMASVRFICGTLDIHRKLEEDISKFFKTEDTILYTSCFDANGGLFETILSEKDVGTAIHYPLPIHRQPFWKTKGGSKEGLIISDKLSS